MVSKSDAVITKDECRTYNKVPDPLSLENRGESWKQFKREWKFYEIASTISKEEDEVRIAALMNVIGREGMDLFDRFQ